MKIVLSRKGFDSSFGGVPSPILADGALVSIPIPYRHSPVTYGDLRVGGLRLGDLVEHLTRGRILRSTCTHLDPDLRHDVVDRPVGWRPIFGQTDAAQTHLARQGVGPGDLFLFYGWFREVEARAGRNCYVRGAPDLHVIFGWLQVAEVISVGRGAASAPDWAMRHPHFRGDFGRNNTVYLARPELDLGELGPQLAGGGFFPALHQALVLTAPQRSRTVWRLPSWFMPHPGRPALSYNRNPARWRPGETCCTLQSAGRGQEFVLDAAYYPEAVPWAQGLIARSAV